MFHRAFRLVLGRKNQVPRFADSLRFAPAENALRAFAPERDVIVHVEEKHGVVPRAFDEQAETFLGFAEGGFGLLQVVNIRSRSEPAEDLTVFSQGNTATNE